MEELIHNPQKGNEAKGITNRIELDRDIPHQREDFLHKHIKQPPIRTTTIYVSVSETLNI